jgi:hypothetical protein
MMVSGGRRRVVTALDFFGLLFFSAAILIVAYGGWKLRIAGIRITAESAWRPLLWAAGVAVLRLAIDRRTPLLGRPPAAWAARLGVDERLPSARVGELPPWREVLGATAALVVAIAVVLHRQVADWSAVSDLGDPLFSIWRLGWVAHQIVTDPRHLFDAHIFYPERATLTYSDSMLLPALIGAPLIWMGVPIAVAYTFLLLFAIVSSGVATYVLARVLTLSRSASGVAGLIFALCQYRFEHYSHLELQMAQWMPLALLAAVRLLATGRRVYFVSLVLAAAAQWYSSMYYGFFLSIYAGVFILVLAAILRPGWRRFTAATTAMVCGLVLALPLARVYKSSEPVRGARGEQAVSAYSARPTDYLVPNDRSVHRRWHVMKTDDERQLFPHVTPLVLAAVGAWPPLTAARVALVAAGWVAFDGSLGFNGHWYRWAYEHLDPLKSVRAPSRFAILVNLTLALFGGFGAERLVRRSKSSRTQKVAVLIIGAVFLIESYPKMDLALVWKQPPELYATLGPDSGAVLFEYPMAVFVHLYFATWHWTPTVNGYSGFAPQSFDDLVDRMQAFPFGETVAYLQSRGVTHVTLNCALWTDDKCAAAIERIRSDPRFRLVVETSWEGKPALLYELVR